MPKDQYHGHGGSYAVNPDTQERELQERTRQPGEASEEAEQAAANPAASKTGKRK